MRQLGRKARGVDRNENARRVVVRGGALVIASLLVACDGDAARSTIPDGSTADGSADRDGSDPGSDGGEPGADGDAPGSDGGSDGNSGNAPEGGLPPGDGGLTGTLDFPRSPKQHLTVGTQGVCVIAADRTVQCSDDRTPKAAENHDFERIVGSGLNVCGVRTDQSLYCWYKGFDAANLLPPGERFVDLTSPMEPACALREDGVASCVDMQSGMAQTLTGPFLQIVPWASGTLCGVTPAHTVRCAGPASPGDPPFGSGVIAVQPVGNGLCAAKQEGELACLEFNAPGDWSAYGTSVAGDIQVFSGGTKSFCYVDTTGKAACQRLWGIEQLEPPEDVTFVDLAQGQSRACGISSAGEVWCWEDLNQAGGGEPAHKVDFSKPALMD